MGVVTSTSARAEDGSLEINFVIPWADVSDAQEKALKALAENVQVAGFRKGKAPLAKAKEKVHEHAILEKALSLILPRALTEAVKTHNLNLAIYPKFELISAKDNEDWQVRAISAEIPNFDLGDYKKMLSEAGKTQKDLGKKGKEEKETFVIKTLIDSISLVIPKILIEEEVNTRLSNLLARIEKLGLSLENYLSSQGKTTETLREEYTKQAGDNIKLDLVLNKIVGEEKIQIPEKEITEAIKVSGASPEQRRLVGSVLARRCALDSLVGLL